MINKLDITKFGVYENYKWGEHFNQKPEGEFGARNIIYGRNYSGKTTLSRIFRCLEKRQHHSDFKDGEYCVTFNGEEEISNLTLSDNPLKIRVYNSDFKKDNLNFLYDDDRGIMPFTILGEENVVAKEKIEQEEVTLEEIRMELGGIDSGGVRKRFYDTKRNLSDLEDDLKKMLKEKASEIRNNSLLFAVGKKRKYDIRDIESELPTAEVLDEVKIKELENTLKEDVKEKIGNVPKIDLNYIKLLQEANEALSIEVQPSRIIQELSENGELQEWVKVGIELHKDERGKCAFCGNNLDENRWNELDRHFTKQVEVFTKKLENLMRNIETQLDHVENYKLPYKEGSFYSIYQEDLIRIEKRLEEVKNLSVSSLQTIYAQLKERRNNIFSKSHVIDMNDEVSSRIDNIHRELSNLIQNNNTYTLEFSSKQDEARSLLRSNHIYHFAKLIDYDKRLSNISNMKNKLNNTQTEKKHLEAKEREIRQNIIELEDSMKDEEKSVKQVNYYLRTFLGHHELYLAIDKKANEDEKLTQFTIMRNNTKAKNLSEGEQSLISFCYFLATLKDITNIEEYSIFIDDPISSLDSNHIFYVFSLLDSEIAKNKYKQVFVSTHNLDFLKYLRKLSTPTNNKNYKNKYYFIEKSINSHYKATGSLKKMPDYLQSYSTEFIYLFHQIYKVANEKESDYNYQSFYNFPNIARKFLETYMFFKYPDFNMSNDKRIQAFFEDKIEIKGFLNRINNEFSHGEEQPDRLLKPIDIPEFKKNAKIILEAIRRNDEQQYYSFLGSIGEMPSVETQAQERQSTY
ncbi:AAA family ATPase [Halobacillus sp. A5]|uniref:AAA family ATPase n=1 Tax=Halobacillus sp. A5 TaxID=2880263 RepID=UPI0020A658A9|nr:AAA family ATPase [Halobacillus sp. A5]MCP3029643.1 AAA family ATPase [Halobacillus sp. A5]